MKVYLDHSATTPICPAAKKAIIDHLDDYGNPSSSYELARKSRLLIEDARAKIAKCINAESDEIFFTSGGSESNTWATHVDYICDMLSSKIEHSSMNNSDQQITVNNDGIVDIENFCDILHEDQEHYDEDNWCTEICPRMYDIVSCMYVNNEIGTIQPIKELVEIASKNGRWFHTDAVQAIGHIPVDVKDLGCDFLSASGHKFGAPKGVGFLYAKKEAQHMIRKIIHGGKQEMGLRGGTENVLGIVAMAAALEDAVENMEERNQHIKEMRDVLLERLLIIEGAHLNGSIENRIASNINIRFDGVSAQSLVTMCDLNDIMISSGSACNEGLATPSHVLTAIGLSEEQALNSVRITIGYENTMDEMYYVANIITKLVERIRNTN